MKKICIIDCGSNKTKNIIEIVEKKGFIVERWYLYYPSINFKLSISTKPNQVILLKNEKNVIVSSSFDKAFTIKYNSIIFSGGGLLATIQNEIKTFFSHLKYIEIPVLGICFGHQIIGLVYQAELYKLENKVSGNFKTQFLIHNFLTKTSFSKSNTMVNKNHSEAITLAKDFVLLAKSNTCSNEMMMHQSKQIYGVQFHPEVSCKFGEELIRNFLLL